VKQYYQDKWVTIYHGDCREILPQLDVKVDLVLTDPPYPDYHPEYGNGDISMLSGCSCRQLIFWSAMEVFPLDYSAIHIWNKQTGIWRKGGSYSSYERIFERNGERNYKVFTCHAILFGQGSAHALYDYYYGHPSQKPQILLSKLIADFSEVGNIILDPFLGSGTTCYCAKKLNRYSIGIEIEEKYCEIAARRCCQEVMELACTM